MTYDSQRTSLLPRWFISTAVLATTIAVWMTASSVILAQAGQHWVGTWTTASVALPPPDPATLEQTTGGRGRPTPRINNQTLRQVVHTSIGGSRVRVVLTNTFGTEPLRVGGASIGVRAADSTLVASSGRPLTFGGQPSAIIEAGATLLSDPVSLTVPALSDLAVDLFLPDDSWATTSPATIHTTGLTTNYLSPTGDHSGLEKLPVETTLQSWFYLARVEVMAPVATNVIVTLGDSITDGTASTPDTNNRWPDELARRLVAELGDQAPGVLNVGIGGNRVLSHNMNLRRLLRRNAEPTGDPDPPTNPLAGFGPSAPSRFDRDVLLQPGVTHVIVLETINDIGMAFDAKSPTVADIIAGHRGLIQRAHARDLKIYGGTLTPFEGAFYFTEAGETKRQAVNEWIRTSGAYDAVFDFDAAMRDPDHPGRFLPAYHSGDWLHPSDEGYRLMGQTVDLALFAPGVQAAASSAPQTPWGAPDLRGIWDFRTVTPLERPASLAGKEFLTAEEAAEFEQTTIETRSADRRDGGARRDVERAYNDFWWDWGDTLTEDRRTSLVVDPPDGRIPEQTTRAKEAARARRGQRPVRSRVVIGSPAAGPEDLGLSERCMLGFNTGPPMLPSAYNNNVQLFQTQDHVVILNEMIHEARIVPLDGRSHLPENIRQWMGDSRGHWEGETLVVETRNFTDKTGSFNPIIGAMGSGLTLNLVERFARLDETTLGYEFTVDDPETFTDSFTGMIPMKKSEGPLFEYACHEGNYGMTNLLRGARVVERAAEKESR